jgi:hypothetical protein
MAKRSDRSGDTGAATNTALGTAELLGKKIEAAGVAAAKVAAATRELRETIAEAHEREKSLKALEDRVGALVSTAVGALIENEVTVQVDALGRQTEDAMRKSVAKVGTEFGKLERVFLGEEADGRPSLRDLAEQIEKAASLKWPLLVKAVLSAVEVSKGCVEDTCDAPADHALLLRLQPSDELPTGGRGHLHLCSRPPPR